MYLATSSILADNGGRLTAPSPSVNAQVLQPFADALKPRQFTLPHSIVAVPLAD